MPIYTRKLSVEAVFYDGTNPELVLGLVDDAVKEIGASVQLDEQGNNIVVIFDGPMIVRQGQYLVLEGGRLKVMDADIFEATYDDPS